MSRLCRRSTSTRLPRWLLRYSDRSLGRRLIRRPSTSRFRTRSTSTRLSQCLLRHSDRFYRRPRLSQCLLRHSDRFLPSPNQATKHVEISHTQYIDKVVAVPTATQRQVSPSLNQVTKHVETPQTHFFDQGVGVPIVTQRQAPQIQTVLKTVEALPLLFLPVVMQAQAPQLRTVAKVVEVSPLLFHRQICGPPQECIWCIIEDACYDTKSLPQPDGVAGRAGLVDQQACSGRPAARATHAARLSPALGTRSVDATAMKCSIRPSSKSDASLPTQGRRRSCSTWCSRLRLYDYCGEHCSPCSLAQPLVVSWCSCCI